MEPVLSDESSCFDESEDTEIDPSFKDESKPLFINQERLNDLVRDLYLSEEKIEILGSRIQQWNLLQEGTTISSFRQRNKSLSSYYAITNDICYCTNVDGLMNDLGYEHNPADWRLFIDSRKTSLKAVLLHNGNCKLSIPVVHNTSRKETYNTIKVLLAQLNYPKFTWKICSDLKVVFLLLGLQVGCIKHMCFLCLWDSRHDNSHYAVKVWPPRENPWFGTYNIKHQPLVDPNGVYLPPFHMKLGLIKHFVKAMDLHGEEFKYLKELFKAEKSDPKFKAGIFVGPEIRKLMVDDGFQEWLNTLELATWEKFKLLVNNF